MNRFFQKMNNSADTVQQVLNQLKDLIGKVEKLEALKPSDASKQAKAIIKQGREKIDSIFNNTALEKTSSPDSSPDTSVEPVEPKASPSP